MTPQLLALRRAAPDVILLFTSNGEDTGNMVKSADELGWSIKVVGSFGATFSGPALKIAGQGRVQEPGGGQLQGLFATVRRSRQSKQFQDFVGQVKAFKPEAFDRQPLSLPLPLVRRGLRAEGSGRRPPAARPTDRASRRGSRPTRGSFRGINSGLTASKTTHFLVGPEALTVVYPDRQREGGLLERVRC